ncbi:MAG: 5' nucleotidase, NT5C type [Solirubrobacteraceae bacterium]
MRIAIDIDSTLHHYWDRLSDSALRRFGIDLPYEEQFDWGITRLKPQQLQVCIEDTHSEKEILASEPYAGAVEVVNAWHDGGHYIHITSHRAQGCHDATARWLDRIGLRHHDLHCSYDKVSRCQELAIDVLIDDSPVNIQRALEVGIVAATIGHPWNEEVCETEDVVCARTWPELATRLDPYLAGSAAA